jgi:23S rRNA (guanine745-N1)-methyltransferase
MQWWEALECPACGDRLARESGTLRCAHGHAFDIARQGYVNLLRSDNVGTGDTRAMVEARSRFFAAGHYRPLISRVAEVTRVAIEGVPGMIVDVGAGTGEYLAAALERAPGRAGLALDASKYACRRAASCHPSAGAVVCDAWGRLPLGNGQAAAVISAFSPRNAAEFARVLGTRGAAIVVSPTARHLEPLVGELGLVTVDPLKEPRIAAQMEPHFALESTEPFESRMSLIGDETLALVAMGPSARHVDIDDLEARIRTMPEPAHVLVSVAIAVWRLREPR